jgi:hypothetical protein
VAHLIALWTPHKDNLAGMNAPGANVGATRANDFPRQANRYGQADGDLPSMRTDPDKAERLTGIYGLGVACVARLSSAWRVD